jgi:Domain of unknown function (DUF4417)
LRLAALGAKSPERMKHQALRLFEPGLGVLCAGCPWLEPCGAAQSEDACRPLWGSAETGGEYVLHPSLPWTRDYLDGVQGPDFSTVHAQPTQLPKLPGYLPQLRVRSSLGGYVNEPICAVRAKEVIGRRQNVLSAAAFRAKVGLSPRQKLVLLLFDRDEILERIWSEGATIVPEIAQAAYDVVVGPSYSTWSPRPRTEFMYNAKRSLVVFAALQMTGAIAVPRVAWTIEADVHRFAQWAEDNPAVEVVALDWSTYRAPADWRTQLEGFRLFDRLTRRHLVYLINGPSTIHRLAEIYSTVPQRRVCITNSTVAAPPGDLVDQLELIRRDRTGATFARRCNGQRELQRAANRLVRISSGASMVRRRKRLNQQEKS